MDKYMGLEGCVLCGVCSVRCQRRGYEEKPATNTCTLLGEYSLNKTHKF